LTQPKGEEIKLAHDHSRGKRIRKAMHQRNIRKTHALAAELEVSVAAVSRWQNGGHVSLQSACVLAETLDVSLDWLLLGRGTMDWHRINTVSQAELQWILSLRSRPPLVRSLLIDLLQAIPEEK
jgi:transcriptional regulator with XRE-family HTH domain